MKAIRIYLFLGFIIITYAACKKLYNPTESSGNLNYLVVEGVINSGGVDSTFIKLSRTTKLSNAANSVTELHATVKIEGDQNASYTLIEKGLGTYALPPTVLTAPQKYRLHIKTSAGKEYVSDYADVKSSPPIDSVTYNLAADGVHIFVNTHDTKNSTRYYRWDYTETYQFSAEYNSHFMSDGKKIIPRDPANQIYFCWSTVNSTDIILASTAKLSQDVISFAPITAVDSKSRKIYIKYSILVRQYALTSDAFTYWENIKKNTENLGTIFDSQPSEISGNIHSLSDATEPVLGYISVGAIETKRIFISKSDLPPTWYPLAYDCKLDTILLYNFRTGQNDENLQFNVPNPYYYPINEVHSEITGELLGHNASAKECVDCRLSYGGVNKQPPFWQ